MGYFPVIISLAVVVTQVYTAPQLISFTDGKLGVNFGGYHAAVGLGGLLGNGAGGGLYAEAGTPHGQSAKAGLGGSVNPNGGTSGGLYAGATAGGNIKAAAGLAGGVNGDTSSGTGFAAAQAGNRYSSSTLIGKVPPSSGLPSGFPSKSINQNNQYEIKTEDTNEIKPSSINIKSDINSIKEIKLQHDVKKDIANTYYQPNNNKFADGSVSGTLSSGQISPQLIEKRIDIGSETIKQHETVYQADKGADQITYKKEINVQRNPTFFEDIFNIPIAALTAVRTFLTNTAGNTSISVQKSGAIQADSESISPKHASSSSIKSSDTQISVKTPNASQLLDDIIAIPINTLGAVNKFLENNVPVRKRVSIENGEVPQTIKLTSRHARRRALRKEIIEEKKALLDSKTDN